MTISEVEHHRIDEIVEELDRRLNAELYNIGFLEGTIDNSVVSEKISDSFSGHALDIAIRAVISNTVLFVTRTWDMNGASIPNFLKSVEGEANYIEDIRRKKYPDWEGEMLEIGQVDQEIRLLRQRHELITSSNTFKSARIHRDEILAHNLEGRSGFRRALLSTGEIGEATTYRELLSLANTTANAICSVIQIWTFSIKSHQDLINHSRSYTRMFWHSLPRLADIEEDPDVVLDL